MMKLKIRPREMMVMIPTLITSKFQMAPRGRGVKHAHSRAMDGGRRPLTSTSSSRTVVGPSCSSCEPGEESSDNHVHVQDSTNNHVQVSNHICSSTSSESRHCGITRQAFISKLGTLLPSNLISQKTTKFFTKMIHPQGFTWMKVPPETKKIYFEELKKEFTWNPEIENLYAKEKNVDIDKISDWDVFLKLHDPKGDDSFIDEKSKHIARQVRIRAEEHEQSQSQLVDMTSIFLEVVGGLSRKKRIFGVGSRSEAYAAASKCSSAAFSLYNEQLKKQMRDEMEVEIEARVKAQLEAQVEAQVEARVEARIETLQAQMDERMESRMQSQMKIIMEMMNQRSLSHS